MKRVVAFTSLRFLLVESLLLSFVFPAFECAEAEAGKARLSIPTPVFDFGSVNEGQVVETIFPIQNNGDANLEIKKIQVACGCTAAVVDSPVIAPGAQGNLKVSFNTEGFQGQKVKTLRLYSNDDTRPTTVVTLKGIVRTEIAADPERVNFGDVPEGDGAVKSIVLKVDPKIEIDEVLSRSENLQIERDGNTLKVTLDRTLPPGIFRGNVVVKTSSKRHPVLVIPAFARIVPDIRFVPASVSYDLLEGPLERTISKPVQIVNSSGTPIAFDGVQSDSPYVRGELRVIDVGKRFELSVSLVEGAVGTIKSRLTLRTTTGKDLSLPVYGVIARKGP